ncbi:MAG: hypothetical protein PHS54_01550 [Clostridia bacterium]|nr:hypothetical protein [Clostridia bacterium]
MTWTKQSKNTSSWVNNVKNSSILDDNVEFLLKQDECYLLLQSLGKIVLSQSTGYKHKNNWENQIKH